MNSLSEFVRARLTEREAIAKAALDVALNDTTPPRTPGAWHTPGEDPGAPSSFELVFEPEAILLGIAAKQKILAEFTARDEDPDLMLGPDTLRQREWSGLRLAVRILAAADADHPDFKPEWSLT